MSNAASGAESRQRRGPCSQFDSDIMFDEHHVELDSMIDQIDCGREGPPLSLHPRRLPVKTAFAAGMLLVIGVVFLLSAAVVFWRYTAYDSLPFFIIGGLGFIPGSYNSFMLYQAYIGTKGFDYSQVPSYDD